MTQDRNKDQSAVRERIANDLRQRARSVRDSDGYREGADFLTDVLLNALTVGAGARVLAMEAYNAIADLVERGGPCGCSCDGNSVECNHKAALGEAEERIRRLTRERDEAARNAEHLMAVVQCARAVHEPEQYSDELYPWCTHCNRDDNTRDDVVLWPCPTVRALDGKS